MSTRSSTRSSPEFKVHKIQRHGIDLFMFNAAEHHPSKVPFLAVVLRPTAQAIGLGEEWFRIALGRSRNEELTHSVKEFKFHPSVFVKDPSATNLDRVQHERGQDATHGGTRPRPYQCLPITKMEVLLNGIDVERLKNPQARASILNLQKTINEAIEHYYHKGGAVNKKATPAQLAQMQQRIQALVQEKSRVLREKARLQKERDSLQLENTELTAQVRVNRKHRRELTATVSSQELVIESKDLALKDLQGKITSLTEDLESSSKKFEKWKSGATRHFFSLKDEHASLQTTYEDLRSEHDLYKSSVAHALSRIKEEFPGFKPKKRVLTERDLNRLPMFIMGVLNEVLAGLRSAVGSLLDQERFTEEFDAMVTSLIPELDPQDYKSFTSRVTIAKKPFVVDI